MTVFVCVHCDDLAESPRSDALTCSAACRTAAHRHSEALQRLKAIAAGSHIHPALILQARAIRRLLPPEDVQALAAGQGCVTDKRIRAKVEAVYRQRLYTAAGIDMHKS